MDTTATEHRAAAAVVDRLWRAYAPYQRGRYAFNDLTSMLSLLVLARFVESVRAADGDFVRQWDRALAEARIGVSPLMDLRAAIASAGGHAGFPVPALRDAGFPSGDEQSDDVPWIAAFLAALDERPTPIEAGLAEVGELLVERLVQESAYPSGEFHTPPTLARLLVELAAPRPGDRILDPACGSGSLLAAAVQRAAGPGRVDGASFEAFATNRGNLQLAMMNLAVHGVERPAVRASDALTQFETQGNRLFDRVVSNPPFNQRIENIGRARWPFGRPPESSANFAWLQLAWSRLSENGIATIIMPRAAAWSPGREAEIRRAMIAEGALLGVIALPANLFPQTSVPVDVWLLARKKSRHLPDGEANAVLFVDAGRLGTRAPRQSHVLTAKDRERISSRVHEWLDSPRATHDEPGFSRSVPEAEILGNEGSLDPRQYVHSEDRPTTAPDLRRMLDDLVRGAGAASNSGFDLETGLSTCEQLTSTGSEPPREPLGRVLSGSVAGAPEEPTPGRLLAGPSGSLVRAEDYVDSGGIPVVMPKDLTGHGFDPDSTRAISERQAEDLGRFRLREGDVVLARRGELGRCAVVRAEQDGWICGTGCFVLRPPAWLDADYFAAYLRSAEARAWLDGHSTGSTTLKTISLDVLAELPVALPDLGTQQAIAVMMRQLDEHERLLREQLALTAKIRQGALTGFFLR